MSKKAETKTTAEQSLAGKETRVVNLLRCAVLALLLVTAIVVSCGVFIYMRNHERENFETSFQESSFQVIESFHDTLERNLGALDTLSVGITSFAKATNQTIPFLTVPDFELRGSNFRIDCGGPILMFLPLITDEIRPQWEEYAMANRFQFDRAYANDARLRMEQDKQFGLTLSNSRALQAEIKNRTETILDDGTGYHPKIWSNGAVDPRGDEPEGSGPFLPLWQSSPVPSQKQSIVNWNTANSYVLKGIAPYLMSDKKAVMGKASVPAPATAPIAKKYLESSQYREDVTEYMDDYFSYIAYPVFDNFDADHKVVAVVTSSLYWKFLFQHLLPHYIRGVICVVENSYNQTFTYRVDGPTATLLGKGDHHDAKYDRLEVSEDINSYLRVRATPRNRAYTHVSLNEDMGRFRIRVFPSDEMAADYETNEPIIYTVGVVIIFVFTSFVFILYSIVVEKRQRIMMETAIAAAQKAAADERDLNEFIAHEVRNPLAAAMSASTFVSTTLQHPETLREPNEINIIREDVGVIKASLYFINDFLRSMLDIQRLQFKSLKLQISTIDILHDVLEPVSAMLYRRDVNFNVILDCPEGILVETDCLRLKQVVLNLARNSSKFVESGFIRMMGRVVEGNVELYVEDSGPGIPPEKYSSLFAKFQTSLDQLSQGTGVGLCLSKQIMTTMNGDLWLDSTYDSGIAGHPGARFVIQLNVPPVHSDTIIINHDSHVTSSKNKNTDPLFEGSLRNSNHYSAFVDSNVLSEAADKSEVAQMAETSHSDTDVETIPLPDVMSILFVDDDAILRKLFVRAVRKVGPAWQIREAASGEIALQLCETEIFDLIFMDQYMASIDKQLLGTETVRELRTRGVRSKICGLSANDLCESFLVAGADHFLLKPMPCAAEDLERELRRILE